MKCPQPGSLFVGLCACLSLSCPLALSVALNALFLDWMTSFETDRGRTAIVQSSCVGVTLGGGLLAALLEGKLGVRLNLLLGSALSTAGFVGGAFAPSLPLLVFSVGIISGSGFCLLHLSTISCAMARFSSHSGFVSSVMSTTVGLCHLGTPVLYRYLSDRYTWRGCLILVAGLAAHSAIIAMLLTSPIFHSTKRQRQPTHAAPPHEAETALVDKRRACCRHGDPDCAVCRPGHVAGRQVQLSEATGHGMPLGDSEEWAGESLSGRLLLNTLNRSDGKLSGDSRLNALERTISESLLRPRSSEDFEEVSTRGTGDNTLDTVPHSTNVTLNTVSPSQWTFMRNPVYLCMGACVPITLSTLLSLVILVLDLALSKGWTVQDGLFFNVCFMAGSLSGRVVVGLVSLNRNVHSVILVVVVCFVGAVGIGPAGYVSSYYLLACHLGLMGCSFGALCSISPAAVLRTAGVRDFPLAQGVICTMEGTMHAVFGVVTGVAVDHLESYVIPCAVYGGSCFTLSCLLLVLFMLHRPSASCPPG